ncbi:MAG TPA: bacteriohopanetetrol glucosamine biosynthesis glycosyltransferase HpnI [Methylomirabilota bacterium]|jgi:ceramide glucosyltransferase|nr:bacteriohopanetetrol glucosamine biosynthesis glycosyltransferase HpnI [Methylomirabilota bacterium]
MTVFSWIGGVLLAGSLVYCILVVIAVRQYLSVPRPPETAFQPVSVIKPLCGREERLEENLRAFFEQDYPSFEILFAVHTVQDPAVPVVEKLRREYAGRVESRLLVTGESLIPNAKAYSLERLVAEARHDLLVMSDSDVHTGPEFLKHLVRELGDSRVGLVTCPYRSQADGSIWSETEAVGMNTEFLGGVLVSRLLEKVKFALGPALAIRRHVLDAIGGFEYLRDFLAEDFVMGYRTAQLGYEVVLSSEIVEHRIGTQGLVQNLRHRLRWARSTRRSRPVGYLGQLFTYPLPLTLIFCAVQRNAWPVALLALFLRAWAAWATAHGVLRDPLTRKRWWLVPFQDILGFLVWLGGLVGTKIVWRGRECTLLADGRLQVDS